MTQCITLARSEATYLPLLVCLGCRATFAAEIKDDPAIRGAWPLPLRFCPSCGTAIEVVPVDARPPSRRRSLAWAMFKNAQRNTAREWGWRPRYRVEFRLEGHQTWTIVGKEGWDPEMALRTWRGFAADECLPGEVRLVVRTASGLKAPFPPIPTSG